MEELFQKWIDEAPATALAAFLLYQWMTTGKEILNLLRDIKWRLDQSSPEKSDERSGTSQEDVGLTRRPR